MFVILLDGLEEYALMVTRSVGDETVQQKPEMWAKQNYEPKGDKEGPRDLAGTKPGIAQAQQHVAFIQDIEHRTAL